MKSVTYRLGNGIDVRVVYGFTGCRGDGVPYLVDIYFAGLPDELYVGVLPDDVQTGGQGAVDGARPEAAAQYQDGFFGRVQAESSVRLLHAETEWPSRFWRTGLPVMIIFSAGKNFSMPS